MKVGKLLKLVRPNRDRGMEDVYQALRYMRRIQVVTWLTSITFGFLIILIGAAAWANYPVDYDSEIITVIDRVVKPVLLVSLVGFLNTAMAAMFLGVSLGNCEYRFAKKNVPELKELIRIFGENVVAGDSIKAIAWIKKVLTAKADQIKDEDARKEFNRAFDAGRTFFRIDGYQSYFNHGSQTRDGSAVRIHR